MQQFNLVNQLGYEKFCANESNYKKGKVRSELHKRRFRHNVEQLDKYSDWIINAYSCLSEWLTIVFLIVAIGLCKILKFTIKIIKTIILIAFDFYAFGKYLVKTYLLDNSSTHNIFHYFSRR